MVVDGDRSFKPSDWFYELMCDVVWFFGLQAQIETNTLYLTESGIYIQQERRVLVKCGYAKITCNAINAK